MKKIVYTAGTWDLFHIGHLNFLKKSRTLGDVLIVGVSTDSLVERCKEREPIIPYRDRLKIIKACRYVTKAVPQSKCILEIKQLKYIKPNIITLGSDWHKKNFKELIWARKNKIKVVYLPYTKRTSTTDIKYRVLEQAMT